MYTHIPFFGFPSHLGHHRALHRFPYAIQSVLISYFIHNSVCVCIYIHIYMYTYIYICQFQSPNSSHPVFFPLKVHTFVLCVSVSISALPIGSFVPFLQIPHICILIYDICFSLPDFTLYGSLQVNPVLSKWHNFFFYG